VGEQAGRTAISRSSIDAVIFDMDGVITDSASVHAAAWKQMFDGFLAARSERTGEPFRPFDAEDYRRFVDGKPRYDGVRSFLQSRGIRLPEGTADDEPDQGTVCGLGNSKDQLFLRLLHERGIRRFETSVKLARDLLAGGVGVAVVSASRNMQEVLAAAGIGDLFPVRVDGRDSDRLGLAGKPDPAIFLEAARRLGTSPARTAVVEDSLAGVEAGRRGGFLEVVGVDRAGDPESFWERGASIVVKDLGELMIGEEPAPEDRRAIRELPTLSDIEAEVLAPLEHKDAAVFLDYDGTLTPIVERPEDATISDRARAVLTRLSKRWPVGILSGRDLADVRSIVGLPGLAYAGSHGFDIVTPEGWARQYGTEFLPSLDAAERELRDAVASVPRARVERKRFAVAVHYRQVDEAGLPHLERRVGEVASVHPDLRQTGGKKVFELRPDVDWDKGRALMALLEAPGLNRSDVMPIYIGDDETDEDAFRILRGRGVGIVVAQGDEDRLTWGRARLTDPDGVLEFLDRLATAGKRV
jgi:trehalose 6-phosphate phosphatase